MNKHFLLLLAALIVAGAAHAQDWPTKPIRLIAPFSAGGGPERVIRAITGGLSQRLGQPVVLDYKPGAGGNLGATDIANSRPDGYSWMLSPENPVTINPLVYKNLGFKLDEVVSFSLVGSMTQVLACHPRVGAKSVGDLVGLAKSKNLSYASGGAGAPSHLTMEMLLDAANVKMTHVPYRGPSAAIQDLLGGQVDCAFEVQSAVSEHIKSNRLIGIAVSTKGRSSMLPDLPTMQEQGFKDFDATFYIVIFAPRGVPADIQAKFGKALDETIRSAEVKEAMAQNGVKPEGMSGEAAQRELRQNGKRWEVVAKRLQLNLD